MEAVDLRTLLGNDSVLVLRKLANLFAKGILINTKKIIICLGLYAYYFSKNVPPVH